MSKGRTIQATIPESVAQYYDNEASKLDCSRSRVIADVLIKDYKRNVNSTNIQLPCSNEDEEGNCLVYYMKCNALVKSKFGCESFTIKNRDK